ncbi:MAG: glycosyltransferase family 2 protein [Deltaproteobacteria bacterium]|nr:glycosyltransferase family 2 protein [Deltaproteobacteria bacterium]
MAVKYSIVVPVFNEESVIDEFSKRALEVMGSLREPCELIFVDDGSTDATFRKASALASKSAQVKAIRLSRNFGHQIAITAGMDAATGEAVIVMDGDLQHPPELIPDMVKKWAEGFHVVNTNRMETEGIPLKKKLFSKIFYKLINIDSEVPIYPDAADFRLMDRSAVEAFRQLREQDRFVRGLTSWIGFRQTSVQFNAPERHSGESKYTLRKMVKFAVNGITSFTTLPLKAVGIFGLVVAAASFVYAAFALYEKLVLGITVEGWTSLLVGILFLGGVQLISIGVLGAYIARIFRQVKNRPLYFVQERAGQFEGDSK